MTNNILRWFLFGLEFFFALFSAFVICWHKFEMSIKSDGRCVYFVCIFYMEMTVHFGSSEWILLILSDGVDGSSSSSANIKLGARSTGLGHNKPSFPLWRCMLSTDRANNNKKKQPNETKMQMAFIKMVLNKRKMQISVPFI